MAKVKKKKIPIADRYARLSIVPIGKRSVCITLFFEKILSAQSEVLLLSDEREELLGIKGRKLYQICQNTFALDL